jgi:hypothetical protein
MLIGDSYTARDDLEACGVWAYRLLFVNFPQLRIPRLGRPGGRAHEI